LPVLREVGSQTYGVVVVTGWKPIRPRRRPAPRLGVLGSQQFHARRAGGRGGHPCLADRAAPRRQM